MELKTIFGALSAIIGVIAFIPYIKAAITHDSQPHPFTWLIFSITQGAGAGITWQGGGKEGSILLMIGAILCLVIFLLSLKKSSRIITKSDIVILSLTLFAIVIWLFLDNALLSILIISGVDAFAYIPTFRKSYMEPLKEPISIWATFIIANSFAILALGEYNILTLTYLLTITSANIALVAFLATKRKQLG